MKNKTLKELTSLDLSNTKNFKKQRLLVEDLVFEVNKAKKEVYTEYLSLLNEKNNYFEMLKCLGIDTFECKNLVFDLKEEGFNGRYSVPSITSEKYDIIIPIYENLWNQDKVIKNVSIDSKIYYRNPQYFVTTIERDFNNITPGLKYINEVLCDIEESNIKIIKSSQDDILTIKKNIKEIKASQKKLSKFLSEEDLKDLLSIDS